MTNREFYAGMTDKELAEVIDKAVFKHEAVSEDLCRGVCQYADEKGNCTRFDAKGDVDCPWSFQQRIENWLNAQHQD